MTNFFKDIANNLGRFIYAWMVPSAVTIGVIIVFLLPPIKAQFRTFPSALSPTGPFAASAVFLLTVLTLSVLFAYASLPLYRLLEGYTLPRALKGLLLRRQTRRWLVLRKIVQVPALPGEER